MLPFVGPNFRLADYFVPFRTVANILKRPGTSVSPAASLILAITLIDVALLAVSDFSLKWHSEWLVGITAVVLTLLYLVYRKLRPTPRLAALLADTLRLLLLTNVVAILSYQLTGLVHLPLMDQMFDGWDRALGLNWLSYYRWAHAHPRWLTALTLAYDSATPQLALLLILLALLQRRQQAQELFYGFAWSGLAVVVIGVLLPASGAFVTYHLDQAHSQPDVVQYLALRSGRLRVIDIQQIQGVVMFPSFHAALAGLYVYVARGLLWLFWPLLVLNLVMLAACPVLGGHYWIDLPAGLLVLTCVLLMLRKFMDQA